MASLNPKTEVLGYYKAAHLLRRACYKVTKSMINSYATKTPEQALNDLFTFTAPNPPTPLDDFGNTFIPTAAQPSVTTIYNGNADEIRFSHKWWWLYQAVTTPTIEYRLTYWLHILFITRDEAPITYLANFDYLELLRYHSNGSLKDLAIRITKNPAMLKFLNNEESHKDSPNQNYAREFLELFTILKGEQVGAADYTNYTDHDVQQAARVFTGFTTNSQINGSPTGRLNYLDTVTQIPTGTIVPSMHDTGNKTFSYAFNYTVITGASTATGIQQEMENFVTMVFNKPETAKNYCRRLYRYFLGRNITEEIETDIITPLANTLQSNNYNIVPTVKQLLMSKHFYDEDDTLSGDEVIGALVKSPIDLFLQMINTFEITIPNYTSNPSSIKDFMQKVILNVSKNCSLELFRPTTVNGYSGYTSGPFYDMNWITTTALRIRYKDIIERLVGNGYTYLNHTYILDTVAFVRNSGHFTNPANAATLIQDFYDLLFVATPQGDRHAYFLNNALLGGLTAINWQNEWNNYITTNNPSSVKIALNRLVIAMVQSPEYQVF